MTLFSASSIKRWMTCPKQENFYRELRRKEPTNSKTIFGSVVHDAFKVYNDTGDVELAKERFKKVWKKPTLIGDDIDKWLPGTTYAGLRKRGLDMIEHHANRAEWEDLNILASEYGFCVPFGDHELRGYIDRLDAYPFDGTWGLKVIDYKTGRKPWREQLEYDVQFTAYDYAVQQPEFWEGYTDSEGRDWEGFSNGTELYEIFKDCDRQLIWFDLNAGKEVPLPPRGPADHQRLYRACLEIQKAIDTNVFVPNISGDACKWCVYTDVCPVMIPISKRVGELNED